jgi:SAM-dependent methyltransferase
MNGIVNTFVQDNRDTGNQVSARAPCDLCGQKSFEPISARDRRGRPLRTVVCRQCGLVRHWHMPTDQQVRNFYSNQYRQDYHGEESPSPRRIMRAWENGKRIYRLLAHYIAPSARVFEVGAGIGCTIRYFAEHRFDASGIEPHAGFQRFAAQSLRAQVTNRDLFDCHDVQDIDLLLLVHVIEHFRSPREALQRIAQMLKTGGLLYMECPNLAAPFALRNRMFHFAHIHNFTPSTLDAMAALAGFRHVVWIDPVDSPNVAGLWCKTAEKVPVNWQQSYEQTLDALWRHNWFSYHLRAVYLHARARKLSGYLRERLVARRFVAQLIRRSNVSTATENVRPRQAA